MPRVRAGDLSSNYVEHGSGGDDVVLAVHGNLGCADWLDLVLPQLPFDSGKARKLSPMDLKSYNGWYDHLRARDAMFQATDEKLKLPARQKRGDYVEPP